MDETILDAVSYISERNIKMMGFTASLSGRIDGLGCVKENRFSTLVSLGINFSQFLPIDEVVLYKFNSHHASYPLYHRGILYANNGRGKNNKGDVLVEFMKEVRYTPKFFVMVDDMRYNLVHIERALTKFDSSICFYGIEYSGALLCKTQIVDSDSFKYFWRNILFDLERSLNTNGVS